MCRPAPPPAWFLPAAGTEVSSDGTRWTRAVGRRARCSPCSFSGGGRGKRAPLGQEVPREIQGDLHPDAEEHLAPVPGCGSSSASSSWEGSGEEGAIRIHFPRCPQEGRGVPKDGCRGSPPHPRSNPEEKSWKAEKEGGWGLLQKRTGGDHKKEEGGFYGLILFKLERGRRVPPTGPGRIGDRSDKTYWRQTYWRQIPLPTLLATASPDVLATPKIESKQEKIYCYITTGSVQQKTREGKI